MKEKETQHITKNSHSGKRSQNKKRAYDGYVYALYSFTILEDGSIQGFYYCKGDPSNKKKRFSKIMDPAEASTFIHTYGYFYGLTHNVVDDNTGIRYYLLPDSYNYFNMYIHQIKI